MAGKWGCNSDLICVFCWRCLESKQAVEWLEFCLMLKYSFLESHNYCLQVSLGSLHLSYMASRQYKSSQGVQNSNFWLMGYINFCFSVKSVIVCVFCSVFLFVLCSCLEEPRWLFLCFAAICCFCCIKDELLCDIFAWFVRSSGLLYFSQPEETIPILQGILERTWDMNKDSKLPMKLVFPFCILIFPPTKSSLIVLQESIWCFISFYIWYIIV